MRILATFIYYQEDKRLHLPYWQFKQFFYQTLLKELNNSDSH